MFGQVETMKNLKERIADVSLHLQSLTEPTIFPIVRDAVEKQDKTSLIEACRKAKIPAAYHSTLVSVLLSVGPDQKWPGVI